MGKLTDLVAMVRAMDLGPTPANPCTPAANNRVQRASGENFILFNPFKGFFTNKINSIV